MYVVNSRKTLLGLGLCLLLALAPAAQGFKIDTHIYLAKHLLEDIKDDDHITLTDVKGNNFHTVLVDERVRLSITNFPGAFLLGTTGADIYPDLIAGQMTTHPGLPFAHDPAVDSSDELISDLRESLHLPARIRDPGWQTDDWLFHVRKRAYELTPPGEASAQIAFAYGYLLHAAMDTWAHSYVNTYTGDLFSMTENLSIAARHTVLENFIKSRHEPLVAGAAELSSREAARAVGKGLQAPAGIGKPEPDFLSGLGAPAWFVRRVIILDAYAAEQHARAPAALPMWAMWAWWQHNNQLIANVKELKSGINAEVNRLSTRVGDAQAVWNTVNSQKNAALNDAAQVYGTLGGLETAALDAGTTLAAQTDLVVSWITSNPVANAVYNAADQALSQVLDYLPEFMLNNYNKAKKAKFDATKAWTTARDSYEALAEVRDGLIADLEQASRELDLRQTALDGISAAKNLAWAGIDGILRARRSNIEQAVDAYVRAFEETGKEIMRPVGSRFDPAGNTMWPVKSWAVCWGPAFGLPTPTVLHASCKRQGTNYTLARNHITYLKNNLFVPQNLKGKIADLEDRLHEAQADALPLIGGIMARLVPQDTVGTTIEGSSEFASTLWDHKYEVEDLGARYSTDGSGRNLPKYNTNTLLQMLEADGLPLDAAPGKETFAAMLQFTPLRNAFNLSKLTLMTGSQLNDLAETKTGQDAFVYTGNHPSAVPLYLDSARAGEVLMGAIRSIDGNHQWLDTAPRLPRGNVLSKDFPSYATHETCRHYGYPFNAGYTLPTDVENGDGGALKQDVCEADAASFSRPQRSRGRIGARFRAKIGFRFWQDPVLRRKVFNCVFKGPLSQGMCNQQPGQVLGCTGDPYPSAYPQANQVESTWQYQTDCVALGVRKPVQRQPTKSSTVKSKATARPRVTPAKVIQQKSAPVKKVQSRRAPDVR